MVLVFDEEALFVVGRNVVFAQIVLKWGVVSSKIFAANVVRVIAPEI
jgi:hypothetical protein